VRSTQFVVTKRELSWSANENGGMRPWGWHGSAGWVSQGQHTKECEPARGAHDSDQSIVSNPSSPSKEGA